MTLLDERIGRPARLRLEETGSGVVDLPLDQRAGLAAVELSIVVPTFNERDNVELLLARLDEVLEGIEWEVIFVDDDSPDGTAARVRELAQTTRRVRCLQRLARRGLSTAVVEGMLASSAPFLAVMDADLQHDEVLLPRMLACLKQGNLDVVVASRYTAGGGTGDWAKSRAAMSGFATRLARLVVAAELTDPMSGFFVMTRTAFERAVRRLSGRGFKILLDLFASTPTPYRFAELPYTFRPRTHGESKLDSLVVWEYFMLLLDKLVGRYVPVRFVLFCAVGASGVVVQLATLRLALVWLHFAASQTIATAAAMTGNFSLNNMLTYRDKRLRGAKLLTGLASFYAVCSIGAVANVGIGSALFSRHYAWWLSGLAGTAVGVVWNYAVSSFFTWRRG
jgi:dolichol-phosphate mannosyltransferase